MTDNTNEDLLVENSFSYSGHLPSDLEKILNNLKGVCKSKIYHQKSSIISDEDYDKNLVHFSVKFSELFFRDKSFGIAFLHSSSIIENTVINRNKNIKNIFIDFKDELVLEEKIIIKDTYLFDVFVLKTNKPKTIHDLIKINYRLSDKMSFKMFIIDFPLNQEREIYEIILSKEKYIFEEKTGRVKFSVSNFNDIKPLKIYTFGGGFDFGKFMILEIEYTTE